MHPTISRYFDHGGTSSPDAGALAELFTEDAVVVDDGTFVLDGDLLRGLTIAA